VNYLRKLENGPIQKQLTALECLKSSELLDQFSKLILVERKATAWVIVHLIEIEKRKLHVREGFPSLFQFCLEKFNFSEGGIYKRIQAARVVRNHPQVLTLLREGKINLSTVKLISAYLTHENESSILKNVEFKSNKDTEKVLARMFPQEDEFKDTIRKLPVPRMGQNGHGTFPPESALGTPLGSNEGIKNNQITRRAASNALKNRADQIIKPISASRYKIEFSVDEAFSKKLQRAKEVLSHKYPQGSLEDIFEAALDVLLSKKDMNRSPKKNAISMKNVRKNISAASQQTRYISLSTRRIVFKRDQGKCTYISPEGKRCHSKRFIEIDHVRPFALGGKGSAQNLRLLCRTHNQFRSMKTFSKSFSGGNRRAGLRLFRSATWK